MKRRHNNRSNKSADKDGRPLWSGLRLWLTLAGFILFAVAVIVGAVAAIPSFVSKALWYWESRYAWQLLPFVLVCGYTLWLLMFLVRRIELRDGVLLLYRYLLPTARVRAVDVLYISSGDLRTRRGRRYRFVGSAVTDRVVADICSSLGLDDHSESSFSQGRDKMILSAIVAAALVLFVSCFGIYPQGLYATGRIGIIGEFVVLAGCMMGVAYPLLEFVTWLYRRIGLGAWRARCIEGDDHSAVQCPEDKTKAKSSG